MADEVPSVAIVVVNRDGAGHLPACLDSISALHYPRDSVETIVVDNASTDGSRQLLKGAYPWVRVLRQESNLGFAEAVNVAARSTAAQCLALANNDMRLDQGWLRGLVTGREEGVPCVAGVILDWDGARIQFADGIVNFHGAAAQVPFGELVEDVAIEDRRALPFACGGSMLVDRPLFLELGGFDSSFFAYFEDVDLGWRLRLAGHDIRLAAASRAFHRHHSTGSRIPLAKRLRLYEANWLRTLLKNAGDENLNRLLAAALLLVVERARRTGDSAEASARLTAIGDVVEDLPQLLERRRAVQERRRVADEEVFARFGRPFFPALDDLEYLDAVERVVTHFELDKLFPAGARIGDEREFLTIARRKLASAPAQGLRRPARAVSRLLGEARRRQLMRALRRS